MQASEVVDGIEGPNPVAPGVPQGKKFPYPKTH